MACITLKGMKTLGEFLKARAAAMGYKKNEILASMAGRSGATIYRFFNLEKEPLPGQVHETSKHSIATALGFREWGELIKAWKADDVMVGIEGPEVVIPDYPRTSKKITISDELGRHYYLPPSVVWGLELRATQENKDLLDYIGEYFESIETGLPVATKKPRTFEEFRKANPSIPPIDPNSNYGLGRVNDPNRKPPQEGTQSPPASTPPDRPK